MMTRLLAAAAVAALAVSPALSPPVAAAEPARLAVLSGAWKGGPAKEGGADYCVQEARFSSGHLLIIGRTKAGEVNLALGIPGGALPVGERWRVTVTVDGATPRERTAVAASKGLLVVGMGFDEEFFGRLKRGKTLSLKSSADDVGFQLSGTAKALGELEKCAGTLPAAAGQAASGVPGAGDKGEPPFPETLTAILGAAGLREVQALVFPDTPPEKRPADYAWRVGKVLGGVRERNVAEGTKFDEVSAAFAQALRERCKGAGNVALNAVERHPGVSLRTGAVDCEGEDGKGAVHVALVSYLSDAHLFAVFFHEATPSHKAEADDIRDRLAEVFRKVARQEPAAAAPVSPPPAAAVKIPAPVQTPVQTPVQAAAPAPQAPAPASADPAPAVAESAPSVPVAAPAVIAPPPPKPPAPAAAAPTAAKAPPAAVKKAAPAAPVRPKAAAKPPAAQPQQTPAAPPPPAQQAP